MFRTKPGRRRAPALALLAAASLLVSLTGCSVDTVTPEEARGKAGTDGKAGTAAGAVDCAKVKCIALTFDAGPGKDTPRLLDILKEKEVPATFFLLGKKHVERYPQVVKRIADEGHEVANHTWTHRILTDLDAAEIRDELSRTQDAIARITGRKPTLMRPPQGRTDDAVSDVSRELGLAQILWSVTAKDYSTEDTALIRQRVLDQAHGDGIILLHDIYDGTVPAVPGIIDELKRRGYTFVTVPQLLAPGTAEPGSVYRPEKDD
ncbi:polysaccharide deacetylase family protein [Streptomyces roseicoloratus]|uniref:Polysaccharide deacetylase family protein n=1 Tax=Streptomyces roseicoloratus TaxID=2508722 RepID=A0ABY9RNC4_9ACTN|nr:polysaccharide deacetylase family protein [Streptomyces roseicoloratus]WMX43687.1 polysaccharide deacetylase family protein [Streptomyces roseicoloratus]